MIRSRHLFHPEALHQGFHLVAGEDAHQIVFERKDETRRAGIALAAGATTQLIVDATRLVTFRPQNVQAAESDDFLVLFLDDPFSTGEGLGPLLFRHLIGIDLFLLENRAP